jgi:hypothetical protein
MLLEMFQKRHFVKHGWKFTMITKKNPINNTGPQ